MTRSGADLAERVQLRRPRLAEKPVPRVGPEPHDAGKAGFEVAKFHGAQQRGEVPAERTDGGAIVRARIYRHDQEDRGAGERCGYGLWSNTHVTRCIGRGHRIALHRVASRRDA